MLVPRNRKLKTPSETSSLTCFIIMKFSNTLKVLSRCYRPCHWMSSVIWEDRSEPLFKNILSQVYLLAVPGGTQVLSLGKEGTHLLKSPTKTQALKVYLASNIILVYLSFLVHGIKLFFWKLLIFRNIKVGNLKH